MVNWTRHWNRMWIPYGNRFQKANVEEWEQEVHTSHDPIQECVDIAGKTPALGLGVPTNNLRKKCSLV